MCRRLFPLLVLCFVGCRGSSPPPSSLRPAPAPLSSPVVVTVQEPPPPTDRDDAETRALEAGEQTITVGSTARMLAAMGSNRVIRLRPGEYDLGAVTHRSEGPVQWEKTYDGEELVLEGVENLTIEAADPERPPRIVARPRYAFVVRLRGAKEVTLRHLVLGHTEAGRCLGGVVRAERSERILIENCDLFGSGTVGVSLEGVDGFHLADATVRECTYGIADIDASTDVTFTDSTFVDNEEFDLVSVKNTPRVSFRGATFRGNRVVKGYGHHFFAVDEASRVVLADVTFEDNEFERFTNDPTRLVVTGTEAQGWVARQVAQPNPEYNEVYDLVRYRQWVVAGTQAGIVFWNPRTGMVDKLVKAYISGQLLVRGKFLWAGTYRRVIRFDGQEETSFLRSEKTRGGQLVEGPRGVLYLKQKKLKGVPDHWWRFDVAADRFVPDPTGNYGRTPDALGGVTTDLFHDAVVRRNGEVWTVDFLRSVVRHKPGPKGGTTTRMGVRTGAYPGRDPRRFHLDRTGALWVLDFESGYFRWDDAKGAFFPESPVTTKASGLSVDLPRGRRWFLHYTEGVHLVEKGQPDRFFDLSRLKYMRAMFVDRDGSAWIAGWTGIVRLVPQGRGGFRERAYVVDASTVAP